MKSDFSPLLYAYIMCVACMWQESTHAWTHMHGEEEDAIKSVETNRLEQVVLKLENN